MLQVWLVLLGAGLLWQADKFASVSLRRHPTAEPISIVLGLGGYACWALSIILFFTNGGTTG